MADTTYNSTIIVHFNQQTLEHFRKYTLGISALLILLGLSGIIAPQIFTLVISAFLGWLLVLSAMMAGYLVFLSRGRSMIAWLKPVLLLLIGLTFLLTPQIGMTTLAMVLAFYLLLDSFSSFGVAHDFYPHKGWVWLVINGVVSLILATLLILSGPASPIMLGLYIGISLLFDGIALLFIGLRSKYGN